MDTLYTYRLQVTAVALATLALVTFIIFRPPRLSPYVPSALPAAASFGEDVLPASTSEAHPLFSQPNLFPYIEVVDSCGPHYDGECVNLRSGPGVEYASVAQLRSGVVLRLADSVFADGREWYRIQVDETIRYPERVTGAWYVAADVVRIFYDEGDRAFDPESSFLTDKRILVDRSEQMLYAYEGDTLFMQESISTGLEFTPTPRGTFVVYKKTPSRYMQGPVPNVSTDYYDLPGVPWDLYFSYGGAVIHGAYWHDNFGQRWSHGCVNLPVEKAKQLYLWTPVGTPVTVQD